MAPSKEFMDAFKKELKNAKSYSDLMGKDGIIKNLLKEALETMLEAELTEQLGYEKNSVAGNNTGNSRNGKTTKTVISSNGEFDLQIPRDRNSEFNPIIIPKHTKVIPEIEDKIISLYAKGISVRDIQSYIEEIYALNISAQSISNITESVMEKVALWQSRSLEPVYPIIFLDAIHFKVKEDSRIVSKAAYTVLSIDVHGHKDMLGIWVGQAESAKFWLNILNELKSRGLQDILIACVDGLKGFEDAILAVFPKTIVQGCVVHQLRNSLKLIASKDQKEFLRDIKPVYSASSLSEAEKLFSELADKWKLKYPFVIKSWSENWNKLTSFYQFPVELRKSIYTTNLVENLHRQFRKVTKAKAVFPNDQALIKSLYLAFSDISRKWTMPIQNWPLVLSQLNIIFELRISKFL